eukprot:gnl/MRDRNA2_/MRDRNA2_30376_c0_seq1.p1 gnl/MRDRNA2_/MRDRNA2_30376_c0~~gnl/MRDRNA2_/MRDRNA2_30376_c0_seq1.p1  ORF type:complete len:947 (-),score=171.62 gnl/MRDRNA2_/MRDRNA2_30376_c0_seq1:25-2814(-)
MEEEISKAQRVLEGLSSDAIAKAVKGLLEKKPNLLELLQAIGDSEVVEGEEMESAQTSRSSIKPKQKPKAKGKAKSKKSPSIVAGNANQDSKDSTTTPASTTAEPIAEEEICQGHALPAAPPPPPPRQGLHNPTKLQLAPTPADAQTCIVQFSTAMYFCKEGMDTEMAIDVIRMGCVEHECSCVFATKDATAFDGKHYEKHEETLFFKRGENMKTVYVKLIDDDAWNTTLEFEVCLSEASGALLGKYLWHARVKKIDDDRFPTNKYRTEIDRIAHDPMALEGISGFSLMLEYFKMNLTNPLVRRRTKQMLVVDQYQNFFFVWRILIMKTIVDQLFGDECGDGSPDSRFFFSLFQCTDDADDKKNVLLWLALLLVLPFTGVHYIAFARVFWKVGGTSRKTMQANMLRRFLNYDESSLNQVKNSDIIVAMTRDSFDVAMKGYMKMFEVAIHGGKLVFLVAVQVYFGAYYATIPVIMSPIVLFTFLHFRGGKAVRYAHTMDRALNEMIRLVDSIIDNYRVIIDYARRPRAVAEYEKMIGAFNWKMILSDAVVANNLIASAWVSVITTGVWMIIGGAFVINGDSTVGTFVANMEIFKDVGEAWKEIYKVMVEMHTSIPNLHRVVKYMNLPTDVEKRLHLNRSRRKTGKERLAAAQSSNAQRAVKSLYTEDVMTIKLEDVKYSYDCGVWNASTHKMCKTPSGNASEEGKCCFTVEFDQGKFIAFVGHPSDGKSTLLKILGGVLLPDEGRLLIPPHLRVVHVDPNPLFFSNSLMGNLTYGCSHSDPDANAARVRKICERLRLPETVSAFLDPNDEKSFKEEHDWSSSLSMTQRQILSIARALVANPEILVLHKPCIQFTEDLTTSTLEVLRDFVDSKGVEMDPKMYCHRRPRTVCMSSSRAAGLRIADVIYMVSKQKVQKVDPATLSTGMFGILH